MSDAAALAVRKASAFLHDTKLHRSASYPHRSPAAAPGCPHDSFRPKQRQQAGRLVNNAGIYSINAVEDESPEQFRRVMETNYFGAVRCIKQVLPTMRKRGSGCIINVTSIAGRVAFSATSAYTASKFALEAFTESLAQEVAGYGIKIALVEPGIIDTAMATTNLPQYDENTIYPHGRRIHAFFTNPERGEASPTLVGEMIRYLIEGDDPRLRFPVGPDALSFLGWRGALSDENWVGLGGLARDADYFERVFMDTGVDLRSV